MRENSPRTVKMKSAVLKKAGCSATFEKVLVTSFLFVTFTFCKAGIVIKGVPITLSNVLCVAIVLYMSPKALCYAVAHKAEAIYYCLYMCFVLSNTCLHIGTLARKEYLFALVVAFSPIMYVIGKQIDYDKCVKTLCVAGIILGAYSIMQWLFGLTQTTVPGITLAWGDAWVNKPIGYGFSTFHESTKMPSTTQNGNNVALLAVLGIGVLLDWFPQKKWFYAKWISVALFFVALILSGSRSACYPFALLVPLGIYGCWRRYKNSGKRNQKALIVTAVATLVGIVVLLQIPQLTTVHRFDGYEVLPDNQHNQQLVESQPEPSRLVQPIGTMSGRMDMWKNMLYKVMHEYTIKEKLRILFIGATGKDMFMGGEGLPIFVSQYGFISALLFMGLCFPLLRTFSHFPIYTWAGLSFCGALLVDSSFNYPPILIWFFLLLGLMNARTCVTGGQKVDEK